MCRTTWEFRRCFVARGCQSTFRMAPGPGARLLVKGGAKRDRRRVDGLPRTMIPLHCSQRIGFPVWAESLYSTSLDTLVRWKVASSASTSTQDFSCPKTMDFCFSTTYAWRAVAMRANISSMALWLIPRARWTWGKEQPVRSMKRVADWSCSDVACGPKQLVKKGCRYWGDT